MVVGNIFGSYLRWFAGSVSDCQIRFGYLLYGYGADLFRLGLYYFIECRSVGGFGVDVGRADDVDFRIKPIKAIRFE